MAKTIVMTEEGVEIEMLKFKSNFELNVKNDVHTYSSAMNENGKSCGGEKNGQKYGGIKMKNCNNNMNYGEYIKKVDCMDNIENCCSSNGVDGSKHKMKNEISSTKSINNCSSDDINCNIDNNYDSDNNINSNRDDCNGNSKDYCNHDNCDDNNYDNFHDNNNDNNNDNSDNNNDNFNDNKTNNMNADKNNDNKTNNKNIQSYTGKEIEIWSRVTPDVEYVKVVLFRGRVVGALLVGDTGLEEVFENLILNQMDVSHVGVDLLDPSLDLEDYFD